jgi:hypothetical protein
MSEKSQKRLAALAHAYQDSSDGNPVISLGYATLYLSSAGTSVHEDPNEARGHLHDWATGAAAFATAAAASASGRPVDEVLSDIQTLISEPGFDGDEDELRDWLNHAFAILGLATVKSAKNDAERAAEEAALAAAVIIRMRDKFATGAVA